MPNIRSMMKSASANAYLNLRKGTYSGKGDWIDWLFYDTMVLDATTVQYRLFNVQLGGTKTRDLTNMRTAGIIPSNQNFTLRAFTVAYYFDAAPTTLQDVFNFLNKSVFEFSVSGKDVLYQKTLADMFGLVFNGEVVTGAANIVNELFVNRVIGVDVLNKKIPLEPDTVLDANVYCTAAAAAGLADNRIRIGMRGELVRLS